MSGSLTLSPISRSPSKPWKKSLGKSCVFLPIHPLRPTKTAPYTYLRVRVNQSQLKNTRGSARLQVLLLQPPHRVEYAVLQDAHPQGLWEEPPTQPTLLLAIVALRLRTRRWRVDRWCGLLPHSLGSGNGWGVIQSLVVLSRCSVTPQPLPLAETTA